MPEPIKPSDEELARVGAALLRLEGRAMHTGHLVEAIVSHLVALPGGWVGRSPRGVAQHVLDALAEDAAKNGPLVIQSGGGVGRLEPAGAREVGPPEWYEKVYRIVPEEAPDA